MITQASCLIWYVRDHESETQLLFYIGQQNFYNLLIKENEQPREWFKQVHLFEFKLLATAYLYIFILTKQFNFYYGIPVDRNQLYSTICKLQRISDSQGAKWRLPLLRCLHNHLQSVFLGKFPYLALQHFDNNAIRQMSGNTFL